MPTVSRGTMKVLCSYLVILSFAKITYSILNGEGHICGRPLGTAIEMAEEKIIAGYDVGYYRYPWFVALMAGDVISCGGTLIGSKAVLTAAHCYKQYISGHSNKTVKLEGVYRVILGMFNKCEKEKTQKQFAVEKVHIHEKYKSNWPYYDIALIILKEKATNYTPICLPRGFVKLRPREGTVPGLGTLKYHGSTPCTLHEARILIYPDEECRRMINRTGNDPHKVFRAFCAGYLQGGIDTCQGDSGGPLQITDEYGNYLLLGIVSFGFHCANPNLLGMYTDVSQYVDWVEEKTGFDATIEGQNSTSVTKKPSNSNEPHQPAYTMQRPPQHYMFVRPMPMFPRPVNIIILRNRKNRKHNPPIRRKNPVPTKKIRNHNSIFKKRPNR